MSGDQSISKWTFQGTFAGDLKAKWLFQNKETEESESIGISVTAGTKYTQKGCTIAKEVNGKIVEAWAYSSSLVPTLTAAGIELKTEPIE